MDYTLRAACPNDRFAILKLGADFHSAADHPIDFVAAHAARTIAEYIDGDDRLALVLIAPNGRVGGALLAAVGISPLAPVRISQELAWWVSPPMRGRAAMGMITAYEKWAISKGCTLIGMAGLNDPVLARFYRLRGYAPTENHFVKVVK